MKEEPLRQEGAQTIKIEDKIRNANLILREKRRKKRKRIDKREEKEDRQEITDTVKIQTDEHIKISRIKL